MKHDLTTGTWQDDTGCPISIILVSTSDEKERVAYVWPYVGFRGVGVRSHDGVVLIRIMEQIMSINLLTKHGHHHW